MSRPYRLVLALTLCVLFLPAPLPAQEDDTFRVGTHVLRRLMHHNKLRPLLDWQQLADDAPNNILVILGAPTGRDGKNALSKIPAGLGWFVSRGGAVLIATD